MLRQERRYIDKYDRYREIEIQVHVGVVLMLYYSPIGCWSISKEAIGQLLGGRNRWNF